jgi:two-component SAPR family response regulator
MVNIAEEDVYFSPLRLWLERKGYFERRNIDLINTHDTQVSVEHLIGGRKYDFLFLRINGAPEAALEFAKMVRELSKETKIILFFAGTKDEFEKSNTNFKDRYDALYDSSKNDIGYPCLRGLLQRAL